MTAAAELASGKGHKDENFPVASVLLKKEHRAPIMAFYRFARAADDVADNPSASADEKLTLLAAMRATVTGTSDADAPSAALRDVMAARGLDPVHALDLLTAFERDCTIERYQTWDDLIDYCRYSAMPVGRYVLDVHGEDRSLWPANDALCAALQIINHLQDCGKDYRTIGRVYVPLAALSGRGGDVTDLGRDASTPALHGTIVDLGDRTLDLLARSAPFARGIRDRRLGMEVAIIQRLAEDLTRRVKTRDPLAERVHHTKSEAARLAASAAIGYWIKRA
ncbi:squalene synthase HpnC [Sphingomonas sp. GC_Shp_3]|uniref:squalene synthase HpnC n=1 Tax=Sphingomonas sp. GC_Shp_3 TaxID=2937383 RepID=UPI002269DA35|nr:squalene synthase HpnC [Sphingomonas sp. GC_Shp_3]